MTAGQPGGSAACTAKWQQPTCPALVACLPRMQFIAENPHLLSREGSQQLRGKLLLLRGWRLPPPLCPLVLARCPPLLKQPEESLQVRAGRGGAGFFPSQLPLTCSFKEAQRTPPHPAAAPPFCSTCLLPALAIYAATRPRAMQEVADILINYGMTSQQLHQVLLAYPYVLCLQ